MSKLRRWTGVFLSLVLVAGAGSRAMAWSHQGHILITRIAALRIINDPAAPRGLREFLKENMKYDMEACRRLAVGEFVGVDPKDYLVGLDGACTLPDRIKGDESKDLIQPYGAPESKMHFMDVEWLSKDPTYKPDLSNRPRIDEIKQDLKDPRWKQAGYLPFRIEESYGEVVKAFGPSRPGEKVADPAAALMWAGYLSHYLADAHQPQHGTVDYKSYSYLAGKVAAVRKVTRKLSNGSEVVEYKVDQKDSKSINPHGDVEFQLFENTAEPRKTLRAQFWKELTTRIEKKSAQKEDPNWSGAKAFHAPYGSFTRALEIVSGSYDYLPAIGKAAQAGYAGGKFDAGAFFGSKDTVHGEELDMVQLIAERKACAVLEIERTLRAAWAQAAAAPPQQKKD